VPWQDRRGGRTHVTPDSAGYGGDPMTTELRVVPQHRPADRG
jgi:hypothetical protein